MSSVKISTMKIREPVKKRLKDYKKAFSTSRLDAVVEKMLDLLDEVMRVRKGKEDVASTLARLIGESPEARRARLLRERFKVSGV